MRREKDLAIVAFRKLLHREKVCGKVGCMMHERELEWLMISSGERVAGAVMNGLSSAVRKSYRFAAFASSR